MAHKKEILVHGVPTETWEFDLTVHEIESLLKGTGMVISGVYANLAALQAAFPNGASGMYQTADTKNVYVWNSTTKQWQSLGAIQGPQGPAGRGIQNITLTGDGSPGTYYTITITYTDNSASTTFRVYNGKDGASTIEARQAAAEAKADADRAKSEADRAEDLRESIEADYEALEKAVDDAESSAEKATQMAADASDSATLSESWAVGGTGSREGENENNSKYWADMAQSYAEQASVPPFEGDVYNIILKDRETGDNYALLVENGRLYILGVSDQYEPKDMTLLDNQTGIEYSLIVESGKLKLEEAV